MAGREAVKAHAALRAEEAGPSESCRQELARRRERGSRAGARPCPETLVPAEFLPSPPHRVPADLEVR